MTASGRSTGFTMLELIVAIGLLSAFMLMLVQLLGSGVGVFQDGERGQVMADRAHAAARAVTVAIEDMIGPSRQSYEPQPPDARLLVTWENIGLDPAGAKLGRAQVVRASVRLREEVETRMMTELLGPLAEEDARGGSEQQIADRLEELIADYPRRERAEMLLLPWPADADGVFLELRRGLFLDGDGFGEEGAVELMDIEDWQSQELPSIPDMTEVIADGILHIEFEFWSQHTRNWNAAPGADGPELTWDSARAGQLLEGETPRDVFGLDIGPESLDDTRDDVFPRWVRITLVVSRGMQESPEAFLTSDLGESARTMQVNRTDLLPGGAGLRFVKVGSEWVEFSDEGTRELGGLRRGRRGTVARAHRAGTSVRAGRTVVKVVRLMHGRDG